MLESEFTHKYGLDRIQASMIAIPMVARHNAFGISLNLASVTVEICLRATVPLKFP